MQRLYPDADGISRLLSANEPRTAVTGKKQGGFLKTNTGV
jgi:hypothetical protein